MRVFPVKKNKIVFSTFEGDGGYCCNPRYIADELIRRGRKYEMIWLLHDTGKSFPNEIRKVKDSFLNVAYHLSTAKIWIDNYRKPYGTLKRTGQVYIQTWHASMGFKAVGLFRGKNFPRIAELVSRNDSALIDYLISNSDYCTAIYPKKLLYEGPVLKTGSPRCDCLFTSAEILHRQIRSKFDLPAEIRIALYAPTFRGGSQNKKKQVFSEMPSLDFPRLKESLEKKFGGKWMVFLRLHPQLSAQLKSMPIQVHFDWLLDVSQEDDMSELLAASDVLITDYSSCAFDAAFAMIPVFLYADDVQSYRNSRGQFMWKREELPFPAAENNNQLIERIVAFDYNSYRSVMRQFMNHHGVIEDGHASQRVVDVIEKICGI